MMAVFVDVFRDLNAGFWNERFWLPPGVNWAALKNTDEEKYPNFPDLRLPIAYAFLVLLIRAVFEWCIARPLGRACGIVDTGSQLNVFVYRIQSFLRRWRGPASTSTAADGTSAVNSDTSTTITTRNHHHQDDDATQNGAVPNATAGTSTTTDNNSAEAAASVDRRSRSKSSASLRIIRNPPKTNLDKFAESCWRFTYYLLIFVYGCVVLWDKPWSWDSAYCWYGYPFQPISDDVWWYYMIELSFYWSLTFSQFVDVQRKDFWVNFVHHITTILLMSFSWSSNFIRPGTIILAIHDAADFWMEAAKMARYCNRSRLSLVFFVVFTVVWFLTRVFLFPYKIVLPGIIDAPAIIDFFPAYYVFNMLVLILLALHVFWSYLIVRIVVVTIKMGEPDDVRSDDEQEEDDNEEDGDNGRVKKQQHISPKTRAAATKKDDNEEDGDNGRVKKQQHISPKTRAAATKKDKMK